MVKIRYSDLPAGLHVSVEGQGRSTVIYLLPGLTPEQRKAALARVRSSARMGHGPELPRVSMALALAADSLRTTLRNGATAMRAHPVLLLPPLILLVSSAIVFVLMSIVTVTVHQAVGPGRENYPDPRPTRHMPSPGPAGPASRQPMQPGGPSPGTSGHHGRPGPIETITPSPSATLTVAPSPGSGSVPDPGSASSSPSPSADPTPTISSAPSASPSPSGPCLKLGPLGLCVQL
jgi:hypothetical protein